LIVTSVFEKNANFFRKKLSKIAENRDHNIDPWLGIPKTGTEHFSCMYRQIANPEFLPVKPFPRALKFLPMICSWRMLKEYLKAF
jgi:hypothetical protein